MTTLLTTVAFASDWVVGSGHAHHDGADALVRRDRDGLPYVPGKTLRGIWRDTAGDIATGMDSGSDGTWTAWSRYVFGGRPGPADRRGAPAHVALGSAVVPDSARGALLADPRLAAAAIIERSSTAIDDTSGCAKDDSLRLEERARAGCVLAATVTVPDALWTDDAQWPGRFLLIAAARTIGRVGGRRRRGAGRCTVTVEQGDALWPDLLGRAERWLQGEPGHPLPGPPMDRALDVSAPEHGRSEAQGWRRFVITMTTHGPVLVARTVLGNATIGHPVVPGSALLPVLTHGLGPVVRAAVRSGDLAVTDATPAAPEDTDRALPAPGCLRPIKRPKGGEDRSLVNVFVGAVTDEHGIVRQTRPAAGYLTFGPGGVGMRTTRLVTAVHNTIDPLTQRPPENGVYSYQAIADGSTLTFEVVARGAVAGHVAGWAGGEARIGGSRSVEYGQVTIGRPVESSGPGAFSAGARLRAGQETTIWLTADCLPSRGPSVDALLAELADALGTELTVADSAARAATIGGSFRRESWQSVWGLPRPSLIGLAAGTCLRVAPTKDVDAERVREVELAGIGRRRAEGFGRVVVGAPVLSQPRVALAAPVAVAALEPRPWASEDGPAAEPAWVVAIRQTAFDRACEDAAARWAQLHSTRLLPPHVSKAQVGRLRAVAEDLTTEGGLTRARAWMTSVSQRQGTRETWPKDALVLLEGLLTTPATVWDLRGFAVPGAARLRGRELTRVRDDHLPAVRLVLLASIDAHRAARAHAAMTGVDA